MTKARGRLAGIVVLAALGSAGQVAVAQESPASAANGASNVSTYDPAFFNQFRPNTAMDMISRIPGFNFSGGSSARGFSGTAGNVLIDGQRPPSRGDSLSAIISRIPASGVARIDVIRGGAEGIDMQGQSIVANIIRKTDAGLTGAVSASVSANDAGNVSPGSTIQLRNQAKGQLFEASLSASWNEGSGENHYVRRDPAGAIIRQGDSESESTFNRFEATSAWETTWLGGSLRINGLLNATMQDYASNAVIVIPGGVQANNSETDTVSGEAGLRYSRSFDGGYSLELVGFQSLRSRENASAFDSSGIVGQDDFISGNSGDNTSGESIAKATLQFPPIGEWAFESGGEAVFNFSERNAAYTYNGAPVLLSGNQNRVEELRTDGFVTSTWKPAAGLSLETGLRFEWSQITAEGTGDGAEKSLIFLKPRINLSWTPKQGHRWGARLERKIDQLDFDSFASSAEFEKQIFGIGNPDAEPEKRWELDLRYERQFGGQNSLVVSYEHTQVEDVLDRAIIVVPGTPPDPDQEFEITRNQGEATIDELEISSSFELDRLGIPGGILEFGGSLRDSNVIDPVTGEERALRFRSPWSWNASLQQTLGGGVFRWALFLEDEADDRNWVPHYLERYHGGMFVGANITWKPWSGWTFGAGVNNILAEDGKATFEYFDAPRTVGAIPDYREINFNPSHRNVFVNLRRDF